MNSDYREREQSREIPRGPILRETKTAPYIIVDSVVSTRHSQTTDSLMFRERRFHQTKYFYRRRTSRTTTNTDKVYYSYISKPSFRGGGLVLSMYVLTRQPIIKGLQTPLPCVKLQLKYRRNYTQQTDKTNGNGVESRDQVLSTVVVNHSQRI